MVRFGLQAPAWAAVLFSACACRVHGSIGIRPCAEVSNGKWSIGSEKPDNGRQTSLKNPAGGGKQSLVLYGSGSFDLIILDLMLQEMDGYEVARQIRQKDQRLPILMLTAKSTVEDRIYGFELGADDYIIKPFHLRELLLRVERMLKRSNWYTEKPSRSVSVAGYRVDMEKLNGYGPRGPLQLTALEASLLEALISQPNRVFSRGELLEKVWGYHPDVETRTVDNFIARLRKYFEEEPEQPQHFISLRGKGYMYVP
jgi:two-component system alkaline phosphatase synthesis response regulator PhoP